MTQAEFEALRNLAGKVIASDIKFKADPKGGNVLRTGNIDVQNSLGWKVYLNCHYDPRVPKVVFNFIVDGTGPICRLCVNGTEHKNNGRFHKHELTHERDPANNLPFAVTRNDMINKGPQEAWDVLCHQANILHTGTFHDPSTVHKGTLDDPS